MKPSLALLAIALMCQSPAAHASASVTPEPVAAPLPIADGPIAPGTRTGAGEAAPPSAGRRPPSGDRQRGDTSEAGLLLAGLALMVGIALRRPGP